MKYSAVSMFAASIALAAVAQAQQGSDGEEADFSIEVLSPPTGGEDILSESPAVETNPQLQPVDDVVSEDPLDAIGSVVGGAGGLQPLPALNTDQDGNILAPTAAPVNAGQLQPLPEFSTTEFDLDEFLATRSETSTFEVVTSAPDAVLTGIPFLNTSIALDTQITSISTPPLVIATPSPAIVLPGVETTTSALLVDTTSADLVGVAPTTVLNEGAVQTSIPGFQVIPTSEAAAVAPVAPVASTSAANFLNTTEAAAPVADAAPATSIAGFTPIGGEAAATSAAALVPIGGDVASASPVVNGTAGTVVQDTPLQTPDAANPVAGADSTGLAPLPGSDTGSTDDTAASTGLAALPGADTAATATLADGTLQTDSLVALPGAATDGIASLATTLSTVLGQVNGTVASTIPTSTEINEAAAASDTADDEDTTTGGAPGMGVSYPNMIAGTLITLVMFAL